MAPPHTMSPSKHPHPKPLSKHPRPGPLTKPAIHRSIVQARLNVDSYTQPSQPDTTQAENPTVEQFRLHREKNSNSLAADMLEHHEIRRRISYTKEQKLAAVSYATTTWKAKKDGSLELISKNSAAADLGITTAMLRDWMKS